MNAYLSGGALVGGAALFASLAGGALPPDPWTLTPTPPTACYDTDGEFANALHETLAKLDEEINRQDEINQGISAQLGSVDPMEQARRMQELMMKDPQAAAKALESANTASASFSEFIQAEQERGREREESLTKLLARYDAEYEAMMAPLMGKLQELTAKLQELPLAEGELPPWAAEEIARLNNQALAAYDKLCGTWWKSGPFHAWLASYRDYLARERIPREEKMTDAARAQFAMMGIAADDYQSTAALKAVRDYTSRTRQIFGKRLWEPAVVYRLAG